LVDFHENWHGQLAAHTKQFSPQLPANNYYTNTAALQLPISNLIKKILSIFGYKISNIHVFFYLGALSSLPHPTQTASVV
jgi:hypothetical protein